MLISSIATFIAAETIPAGARVKLVAGSGIRVELADAADVEIGTAILHSGKDSYAADTEVGVALLNHPGTRTVIAAGAFAAGAKLQRMANGKVDDTGAGKANYIALEASAADGDKVEALFNPSGETSAVEVVLTSTNGTAAAAVDLAALKTEAEKIGDDVRAIHAALVTQGILS